MYLLRTLPLVALLSAFASGSVTIVPGATPKAYSGPAAARNAVDFFKASIPKELNNNETVVLMSSHDDVDFTSSNSTASFVPSGDSFVRGALEAWGQHLHLVIRPDEVWFAVLVQMNYYMSTHAEEIRDLFVDHEGKEVIEIWDFTWYAVIRRFADEIQARVKTDWLEDWIMPGFTTSGEKDYMTANVLMMGLMQEYFEYVGGIICGLPSVTLLGEKADWERLEKKLDRLAEFGPEPEAYGARLKPIFRRFIKSFEDPEAADVKEFWNLIASGNQPTMCGEPFTVSGWITAFFYWDTMGRAYARTPGPTSLDDVVYPTVPLNEAWPVGWAKVPFTMKDFMDEDNYEAFIIGGNLGKEITPGAPRGYVDQMGVEGDYSAQSILQPGSGWVLYGPTGESQDIISVVNEMGLVQSGLRTCQAIKG